MTNPDHFENIKSVLVDVFEIEPERVTMDAHLLDDLELDSIDGVDMMVKLQEDTGKKVTPEQFETIRTVADLVTLVKELHG
ncbi:MAG: acyl carrier protein [Alphaproteobacteria bacterium]|nr:acyl carrier protein [Alphaproteobacteria bacterium]